MTAESNKTRDHHVIKNWVQERGGKPAIVKGTDGESTLLRIDFPGYSGAGSLEEITWEEFFEIFDDHNLEFLYQEETSEGELSRFNKFVRA